MIFDMNHPVPTKPKDEVKEFAQDNNALAQKEFDSIVELFEQRPIWTLSAIRAHIREPPKRLSKILACIAFYYTTGPWRNCFVKFGYDARKNFDSRFYQMIDYRVRQGAGFKGELKRKSTSAISKRVKVHQKFDGGLEEDEIDTNYMLRQKEAIFTVDTIPPFRARNYQLIDIQIPKIQEMLKNIPSPITGAHCDEKRGWFPQGFLEDVRSILSNVSQTNMMKLCKEKNISLDEFKGEDEDSNTNQDIDEDTASSDSNEDTSDEDAESE
jgi:general transcription factor 3C polypeptide 5 (transcription factor C subunit 1)